MHGFEEQMDDIRAVMDVLGSKQCCHVGVSVGGRVALLFAATYPERTTAVATIASHPATLRAEPDYPWGSTRRISITSLNRCSKDGAARKPR